MLGDFREHNGMALGNLVAEHINVNKYTCPDLVLGKGPTQSITSFSNGSFNTGTGFKGAEDTT